MTSLTNKQNPLRYDIHDIWDIDSIIFTSEYAHDLHQLQLAQRTLYWALNRYFFENKLRAIKITRKGRGVYRLYISGVLVGQIYRLNSPADLHHHLRKMMWGLKAQKNI